MVHELPEGKGIQVTALNFGSPPIDETIKLPQPEARPVVDMIHETNEATSPSRASCEFDWKATKANRSGSSVQHPPAAKAGDRTKRLFRNEHTLGLGYPQIAQIFTDPPKIICENLC